MLRLLISLCLMLTSFNSLKAAPIGTVPMVDDGDMRFNFEYRSDLWTSPYHDKENPVRLTSAQFYSPVLRRNDKFATFNVSTTGVNLGRADIFVGDRQVALGQDLQDNSIGLGYSQVSEDKYSFLVTAAYTSASDHPFNEQRNNWVELNAILNLPPQENYNWIVALNYSKNRGYFNNYVFPFVGINYDYSAQTNIKYGFPFLWITSKYEEKIVLEFFLSPGTGRIQVLKDLNEKMKAHVRVGLTSYSYLHENRIEDKDRLFFQERSIEAGLVTQVSDQTSVGFNTGYAFERIFFEGENLFKPKGQKAKLGSDLYGSLVVEFKL